MGSFLKEIISTSASPRYVGGGQPKTTLEDLAHQAQYLLDPQGGYRKASEKDDQWTEVLLRNTKGHKEKEKAHRTVEVQGEGTPSSPAKNGYGSKKSWEKAVNQLASAPSSSKYELDSSLMDSGSYCRVCYSISYVASEGCHSKHETQFVEARTKSYEARFREIGGH